MLVYANHLSFQGAGAEEAVFKALGGWLKEQLGFGLHPNQLRTDGTFDGFRNNTRSWLRVYATHQEEPELYSWVLKNGDDTVRGRQWITELGLKKYQDSLELSCVLKTDEQSTLVSTPVSASRPRVIRYIVNNLETVGNAEFAGSVPGIATKKVGESTDSYRGLLEEIKRQSRDYPLVVVSPTSDGDYLLNTVHLQQDLVGLAQVVQCSTDFNSYEMEEILGQRWSAWSGAVNVLHTPTSSGYVHGRLFLSDVIRGWGDTQHDRISELLAWVTSHTNVPRLRNRIRPEGVSQLALRRRLQAARAKSVELDAAQLRLELDNASRLADEQAEWIRVLEDENSGLESDKKVIKAALDEARGDFAREQFATQALKDQLASTGAGRTSTYDIDHLLHLASRTDQPTPLESIDVIENVYGDRCIVLESARDSARTMNGFVYGRQLLDMLIRLVTQYRTQMMEGGDNLARAVFGKGEYAAKESDTVMGNKAMRRARTFEYRGAKVEMFRHLKIGVADDASKTIRVHFYWGAEREKIVVGYCGKHLPIPSH